MVRVDWKDGQLLLPEHFIVSENSQLISVSAKLQALGVGYFGFADIQYEKSLLDAGILDFKSLKFFGINGQIFGEGVNLTTRECNLSEEIGQNGVLYFHVLPSDSRELKENDQTVEVTHYKGILSVKQSLEGSISSFPFLKVFISPSNIWNIQPNHNTPIFSFRNSCIWSYYEDRIQKIMLCITQHLKDDQLKADISSVKFILGKLVVASQCRLENKMRNIDTNSCAIPGVMFEVLYDLYISYSQYTKDVVPDEIACNASQICGSFDELIHGLEILSGHEMSETSMLDFIKGKRYFQLNNIPSRLLSSTRVYLLIQTVNGLTVDVSSIKLASIERVALIVQKSLPGIPLSREKSNQFSHLFDSSVIVYRIEPGQEWDYVIAEASLALSVPLEFFDFKVYLYSPEFNMNL